jgi:hypothetical protein
MLPQVLPDRPTAITLIADQPCWASLGAPWPMAFHRSLRHKGHKEGCLMVLSGGQQKSHGLAVALGAEMDVGAEASLAAP